MICERKGPWDMGPGTQNGTGEEKRTKKVLEEEPGMKDISAGDTAKQVAHQSSWEISRGFLILTADPRTSDLSLYPVPG